MATNYRCFRRIAVILYGSFGSFRPLFPLLPNGVQKRALLGRDQRGSQFTSDEIIAVHQTE
jgi:hypothetical protein